MPKPDIVVTALNSDGTKDNSKTISVAYSPPLVVDITNSDKPKLIGVVEDVAEAAVTALYRLLGK